MTFQQGVRVKIVRLYTIIRCHSSGVTTSLHCLSNQRVISISSYDSLVLPHVLRHPLDKGRQIVQNYHDFILTSRAELTNNGQTVFVGLVHRFRHISRQFIHAKGHMPGQRMFVISRWDCLVLHYGYYRSSCITCKLRFSVGRVTRARVDTIKDLRVEYTMGRYLVLYICIHDYGFNPVRIVINH